MRNYPNAAAGLKLLFYAEILTIIAAVVAVISGLGAVVAVLLDSAGVAGLLAVLVVVAGIAAIVALVLNLVGLNKASADDQGYRTAFLITIANLVIGVVSMFVGSESAFAAILDLVSTVLGIAVVYYVITVTSSLTQTIGNDELPGKGQTAWKVYLVGSVLVVAATVLGWIPALSGLANAVSVGGSIVQLVGYILYLIFLNGSYKALA